MKNTNKKRALSLGSKLSAITLVLATLAPLPTALAPFSAIAEVHAQANPCAPSPAKARTANPCAPQKARPANPCAPKAGNKAAGKAAMKAKTNCDASKNPCAPARKCDEEGKR